MTPELLDAATGCGMSRARLYAGPITDAMEEFGINTPARQAAFLAQVGHESGSFAHVRELWGPTEAQKRYEGRADLGNTEPGDGFAYRGRGLIQITGRANYRDAGYALRLPLVTQPSLLESPVNAARSAAWFWMTRGCNALADAGAFERITRRINGGMTGYSDRCARLERAKKALWT